MVKSPTFLSFDDVFTTNFPSALLSDNKEYMCLNEPNIVERNYWKPQLKTIVIENVNRKSMTEKNNMNRHFFRYFYNVPENAYKRYFAKSLLIKLQQ